MPLQPHAQKEVDERVTTLARAFKAGFAVAKKQRGDLMPVEYEDFFKFVETFDIITANFITRELFDAA